MLIDLDKYFEADFENDLQQMIKRVDFRQISNSFQGKPKNDIKHIKESKKIFRFCRQIKKYIQSLARRIQKAIKRKHYQKL